LDVVAAGFGANSFCHQDLAALASPMTSSTVLLTSRKLVLASRYSEQSSVIPLTQALAAKRRLIGSISRAYQFVDNRADKAWPQQHRTNYDIKQILNARHASITFDKGFLNGGISLSANCFMHSKVLFHLVHQGTPVAVTGFFLASI
jgi:hypothetical protein